jgi:hypothetical protein
VERVFEVTWCASTTSLQLTLFLVGLRGICTGSRHMEGTFVPEGCALTRRMVKGDGRPGRGRCLAEEDEDEYDSRIEWPPGDFIAAFKRQVKRD